MTNEAEKVFLTWNMQLLQSTLCRRIELFHFHFTSALVDDPNFNTCARGLQVLGHVFLS